MRKPTFTFDELYAWTGGHTGSLVLDDILNVLRNSRLIRVKEVAQELDLPVSFLEQVTTYMVGMPFKELIVQWRVRQCAQFLQESDLSYAEIAEACGWKDPSTMIRVFERYMDGKTPLEYRTGHQSRLRR